MVRSDLKFCFSIFLISFTSISAQATMLCNSVDECQILRNKIEHQIRELKIGQLQPMTIDNANGGSNNFAYPEWAAQYCTNRNSHLPTAREWALFAMVHGAKGISEVTQGKPDKSYELIEVLNLDGSTDRFYYSNEGVQQLPLKRQDSGYWSSSERLYNHKSWYDFFQIGAGSGRLGYITVTGYYTDVPVSCFSNEVVPVVAGTVCPDLNHCQDQLKQVNSKLESL